jgi:SAM-dependent methyltransferase
MANDHPSTAAWHDSAIAQKYVNGEKATRPYAKILVEKSNLADAKDAYVLDLACGTGAVIQEIYDAVPREKWGKLKVHGGDVSQPMLDYLKTRGEGNGWVGLETGVVDGNVCILLPFASYIPSSQLSRRTFKKNSQSTGHPVPRLNLHARTLHLWCIHDAQIPL